MHVHQESFKHVHPSSSEASAKPFTPENLQACQAFADSHGNLRLAFHIKPSHVERYRFTGEEAIWHIYDNTRIRLGALSLCAMFTGWREYCIA
eukprot:scaffold6982_cov449-Prasinococcus_capsulatus_cf.AAC.6